MQKITPNLWFDSAAEEAANFYVSVFKDGKIGRITRYTEASASAGKRPVGSVLTVSFTLFGQEFVGINGGPAFKFTPAVSLSVSCKDQAEIDEYWSKLTAGGKEVQCGWLEDKYGLSWQIVPDNVDQLLQHKDPQKSARAWQAMLKMKKIDIATLKQAVA